MLLLPNGQIMLTSWSNVVEFFTPDPNLQNWPNVAPIVTVLSSRDITGGPNNSYAVQGYQLNGLSQANMYGDDYQAASNYPLVVLQDPNNLSHTVFAQTANDYDPSGAPRPARPTSIAPNHVTGTYFTVPSGTCSGSNYNLYVIANGVWSDPQAVSVTNIKCSNGD